MLRHLQRLFLLEVLCDALPLKIRHTISLVQEPYSNSHATETTWKERVDKLISSESTLRQDALYRLIGDICHDLEERCATAEQPFRKAQSRVETLERDLAHAMAQRKDLETQVVDYNLRFNDLETRVLETEESLQADNERLNIQVQALEEKLKQTEDGARSGMNDIRSDYDSKELELRAALAAKECYSEELAAHLEVSEKRCLELEASFTSYKAEVASLQTEQEAIKRDFNSRSRQLEKEINLKSEAEAEVHRLQAATTAELEDLRKDHDNLTLQSKQQRTDQENEFAALKNQVQSAALEHTSTVNNLQHQLAQQKNESEERLKLLSDELECTKVERESLRQQHCEATSVAAEQRHQIGRLEELVASKNEEIAGFQAMRQTLAAAIGNLPERKHPRKSVRYAASAQRSPVSRRRSRRLAGDIEDLQTPHGTQTLRHDPNEPEAGDLSFESNSSRSGSTPKRAKPHKPFKVPVVRQPRLSAATPRSTRAQNMRLPLVDVSTGRGNMSPIRRSLPAKLTPSEKGEWENLRYESTEAYEDLDFGCEIFTSMPFTPGIRAQ